MHRPMYVKFVNYVSFQVMYKMFYVRVDFYGCVCVCVCECARFISVIQCILMKFGIGDQPSVLLTGLPF